MIVVEVPFNNTKTQSFEALKNGVVVISRNVVINKEGLLPHTHSRSEVRLDKVSRDTSTLSIWSIDYDKGIATFFLDDQPEEDLDFLMDFLANPQTRIFINALTMNDQITAITGFTAAQVF